MLPTVAAAWRLEVLEKFWRCTCRCGHGSWKYTCRFRSFTYRCGLLILGRVLATLVAWFDRGSTPTAAVMDFACLPTVVLESSLRTMAGDQVPRTFSNTRRPPRQALLQDLNHYHNRHASTVGTERQDATHISRSRDHKGRYTSQNQASRRYAHLHEPNGHDM